MENRKLYEYLQKVEQLQKQEMVLDATIQRLDEYMNQLGVARTIQKPNLPEPDSKEVRAELWKKSKIPCAILTIFFLSFFATPFKWLTTNLYLSFVLSLITGAVLGCFLGRKVGMFFMRGYYNTWKAYYQAQAEANSQAAAGLNQKPALQQERQVLVNKKADLHAELEQLYAQTQDDGRPMLHPNYRDIMAVSKFIEYLENELCTKLEGVNGGYHLYDNTAALQQLTSRFDLLHTEIDSLRQGQGALYNTLQSVREHSQTMCRQVLQQAERIEATQATVKKAEKAAKAAERAAQR